MRVGIGKLTRMGEPRLEREREERDAVLLKLKAADCVTDLSRFADQSVEKLIRTKAFVLQGNWKFEACWLFYDLSYCTNFVMLRIPTLFQFPTLCLTVIKADRQTLQAQGRCGGGGQRSVESRCPHLWPPSNLSLYLSCVIAVRPDVVGNLGRNLCHVASSSSISTADPSRDLARLPQYFINPEDPSLINALHSLKIA